MLTYGAEFTLTDLWQKKLGPAHIAGNESLTLCGLPMLGNNYSKFLDLNNLNLCEECLKLHSKRHSRMEDFLCY
jgi:hypothetical protein